MSVLSKSLAEIRRLITRRNPSSDQAKSTLQIAPELHPECVLIASYPRSGNTWFRYLVADVIEQSIGIETATKLPVHVDKIIPDLDRQDDPNAARELNLQLHLQKTHSAWRNEFPRAIVLTRDPVDSLVSYFHFHQRYDEMRKFANDGIDAFCLERLNDWMDHQKSFESASSRGDLDAIFLRYENLHQSPHLILEKVFKYLDYPADSNWIERAVTNHRFNNHQKKELPKAGTSERFFRKGEIGSGYNELSPQTVKQIQFELQRHGLAEFCHA